MQMEEVVTFFFFWTYKLFQEFAVGRLSFIFIFTYLINIKILVMFGCYFF